MSHWTTSSRFLLVASALVAAAAPTASAQNLSYPELTVAPRASDRLQQESVSERQNKYSTHIPIQASALGTLAAGFMALRDPGKGETPAGQKPQSYWAGITGCAVGGGWLAITGIMSSMYTPYKTGYDAIKSMPVRTTHEQLTRERAAEEEINTPARLGTRLTVLSVVTNLAANGYILGTAADNMTRVVGGIGATLSMAPILFQYRWNTVAEYQGDYKKRIYGPLSSMTVTPAIAPRMEAELTSADSQSPIHHRVTGWMPTLNLSWSI